MIFKKVRKAMIDRGFKVKDLAEITGFTRGHISAVINGRHPSVRARKAIALALGKDFGELWGQHDAN